MDKDRLLYSLCYVDVETTGLDEERHEMTEVGAIRVDYPRDFFEGGEPEEVESLSVKIKIEGNIDPSAGYMNHYDPEVWAKEGIALVDAMYRLFPLIKEANLAGWNVDFDRRRIMGAYDQFGWQWPYGTGHRLVDVQSLARPFVAAHFREERNLRKVRLGDVAKALGLVTDKDEDKLHEALFDCRTTWRVNDLLARAYYRGLVGTGLVTPPPPPAEEPPPLTQQSGVSNEPPAETAE